jgi:hypothetical protein
MFLGAAQRNINRYFATIETALDKKLFQKQPAPPMSPAAPAARTVRQSGSVGTSLVQTDLDQNILRLKLYVYATIACENSGFECKDEEIDMSNTFGVIPKRWLIPAVPHMPELRPAFAHTSTQAFGLFPQRIDLTRPYAKYDFMNKGLLGNQSPGLGEMYHGRGFYQLTGLFNYKYYGRLAGIPDLVLHPWKASEPNYAALILAEYTLNAKHRAAILHALANRNFKAARAVVNGDNPRAVKNFTTAYCAGEAALSRF